MTVGQRSSKQFYLLHYGKGNQEHQTEKMETTASERACCNKPF